MAETRARIGRPPKLGATKTFPLRLPLDLHRQVLLLATAREVSANALLVEAVAAWFANQPERNEVDGLAQAAKRPREDRKRRGD